MKKSLGVPLIIAGIIAASVAVILVHNHKVKVTAEQESKAAAEKIVAGTDTGETSAVELLKDYKWQDYLELGKYKGLSATKTTTKITDEIVKEQIIQDCTTQKEVKDRVSKKHDVLTIDYSGTTGKNKKSVVKESDVSMTLGQNEILAEFDKKLTGKKTGAKITFQAKYPDDYYDEALKAKTVSFTVKIKKITEVQTPDKLTDKLAKKQGYDSLSDYKKAVRDNLESNAKQEADSNLKADILNQILDKSKLKKTPKDLLKQYENQAKEEAKSQASQFGMSYETFLASYMGGEKGLTESATNQLKEDFVYKAIGQKENIILRNQEYQELAKKYFTDSIDSVSALEEQYGRQTVLEEIYKDKVYDQILSLCKITDKEETQTKGDE